MELLILALGLLGVAILLNTWLSKKTWMEGHAEGLLVGSKFLSDIFNSLEDALNDQELTREAFERQFGVFGVVPEMGGMGIPCGLNITRDTKGRYVDLQTSCYWKVWVQSQLAISQTLRQVIESHNEAQQRQQNRT